MLKSLQLKCFNEKKAEAENISASANMLILKEYDNE